MLGRNITTEASDCASGSQFPQLDLAHTKAAKDLGIVLAELGGDCADPHTLADLDRGADVRHLTQFRVARISRESLI
jgi:hypothetical protein